MKPSYFTFPENCFLSFGIIKNVDDQGYFTDIDINDPKKNLININKIDYCFTYLNGGIPGNKGGNSILLKLYEFQNIDEENIEYNDPDLILKISKSKIKKTTTRSEERFKNEIECLTRAKDVSQNIIQISDFGTCKIKNERGKYEDYYFYTMEYAPYDLKSYIEANHDLLNLENKVSLCLSICHGLSELWKMGIYHRDIKPDNIFFTYRNVWKIGDLGLASEQNKKIDTVAEFIGPKGWLSPEAMNKYLTEGKGFLYKYNCVIDHQSDIFQLGKVFWYIFQFNSPEGCIKESDFQIKNSQLYQIIRTMLNYSKSRRFADIEAIIQDFKKIDDRLFRKAA